MVGNLLQNDAITFLVTTTLVYLHFEKKTKNH